jgi:hypothetical protein
VGLLVSSAGRVGWGGRSIVSRSQPLRALEFTFSSVHFLLQRKNERRARPAPVCHVHLPDVHRLLEATFRCFGGCCGDGTAHGGGDGGELMMAFALRSTSSCCCENLRRCSCCFHQFDCMRMRMRMHAGDIRISDSDVWRERRNTRTGPQVVTIGLSLCAERCY